MAPLFFVAQAKYVEFQPLGPPCRTGKKFAIRYFAAWRPWRPSRCYKIGRSSRVIASTPFLAGNRARFVEDFDRDPKHGGGGKPPFKLPIRFP